MTTPERESPPKCWLINKTQSVSWRSNSYELRLLHTLK